MTNVATDVPTTSDAAEDRVVTPTHMRAAGLLPSDGVFVGVFDASGQVMLSGYLFVDAGVRGEVSDGFDAVGGVEVMLFGLDEVARFVSVVPSSVRVLDMPTVRVLDSTGRYLLRQLVAERAAMRREVSIAGAKVAGARASMSAEFDQRLEALTDAAHEYADDNNLCSVFDDFMSSQGLRTREKDFEVEIDASITVRVSITRTDRDGDGARDQIDRTDVRYAVAESLGLSYDAIEVTDYDVTDVTAA